MTSERRHITCTLPAEPGDLALLWFAKPGTRPPSSATAVLPVEWLCAGLIVNPAITEDGGLAWLDIEFDGVYPAASDLDRAAVVIDTLIGTVLHRRWFATVVFHDRLVQMGDRGFTCKAELHPTRETDAWTAPWGAL